MTTRATRFFGPVAASSTAGGVDQATVPAGKVWLIRDFSVVNASTTAAGGASLGIGGIANGQLIHSTIGVAASEAVQVPVWQLALAGEHLYTKKLGSSGSVTVMCSGYELEV